MIIDHLFLKDFVEIWNWPAPCPSAGLWTENGDRSPALVLALAQEVLQVQDEGQDQDLLHHQVVPSGWSISKFGKNFTRMEVPAGRLGPFERERSHTESTCDLEAHLLLHPPGPDDHNNDK